MLKKNRWKCNKHLLKCRGWSFPLFLSPLANLSVIQSMVVGIQIVASQLKCSMPHCSGHFLHTYCSVSHFLYSQKFYLVPSLQQGFNFFMTKTMFHILSPPSFIPFTLSFQSLSRIFFFFWGGGATHIAISQ